MAITLKDVAKRAGVSRSAVSRTFTVGASVSGKMRERVEYAAIELGYRPNALASSLTTGRTKLIGLVSNNFQNPMFLEVFDLFTRGLQDRGLRPLFVNLTDETNPENSVKMLQQYSVDGVVVATSTLPPSFAKAFRDALVPVVHCFGRNSSEPQVHVVGIDNIEAGRMAARELMKREYRRIGFLGGPRLATTTKDRMAGFCQELNRDSRIDYSISYAKSYSFQAGRQEMLRLLHDNPKQAYFCGDDVLSIGALSAIKETNLKVPENIGIIGFNDMQMAGWEYINLTTIHQPITQIINSSIELMVAMLNEPDRKPEIRLYPCHVAQRGTLKPLK